MKKVCTLIMVIALVAMAANAGAARNLRMPRNVSERGVKMLSMGKSENQKPMIHKAASKALVEGERMLSYCNNEYDDAIGIKRQNGDSIMVAACFTEDYLIKNGFVGGKITKVIIPIYEGVAKDVKQMDVWVAVGDIHQRTSKTFATPQDLFNEVELETPVEIDGEDDIYIGASFVAKSGVSIFYCIPVNYSVEEVEGGLWVGYTFASDPDYWKKKGYDDYEDVSCADYGNAAISAKVSGLEIEDKDLALTDGAVLTNNVKCTTPVRASFTVKNYGKETVNNFEVDIYVNDQLVGSQEVECDLATDCSSSANVAFSHGVATTQADNVVELKISKVNGSIDSKTDNNNAKVGTFNAYEQLFDRNVVVEEGTGTWCGYCVRGIAGMEAMAKAHPDDFIGIAAHFDDEMDYILKWYEDYGVGIGYTDYLGFETFPNAIIDRDRNYANIDPTPENLEAIYQEKKSKGALARIDATAEWDGDNIVVEGDVEFCYNDSPERFYCVTMVLIEDNVGPYNQVNNYGNNQLHQECYGFEKMGKVISWTYKDVARGNYPDFWGDVLEDVYYGGIKAYTSIPFSFTHKIENEKYLSDDKLGRVGPYARYQDAKNLRVAVLLTEQNDTGEILNATKCAISGEAPSGVDSIEAEEDGVAEYYSIDGRRLNGPAQGFVIVKKNGKASKAIMK